MILVETLRLRRWSIWWAALIAAIGIFIVLTVEHVHTVVNVNGTRIGGINISLAGLAPMAMFLTMIFATSAGFSLNREGQTLALSWTKPVARPLIALRIMAVDAVAIVAAYAFAWLVILGVIAGCGGSVNGGPDVPATIVLALGVALMWYALIESITSAIPSANTGVVAGFLWPGALILASLSIHINAAIDLVIRVLNVLNPLAYMNGASNSSAGSTVFSYWQAPPDERALVVWLLAVALAAIGIVLWTRREA